MGGTGAALCSPFLMPTPLLHSSCPAKAPLLVSRRETGAGGSVGRGLDQLSLKGLSTRELHLFVGVLDQSSSLTQTMSRAPKRGEGVLASSSLLERCVLISLWLVFFQALCFAHSQKRCRLLLCPLMPHLELGDGLGQDSRQS